MRVKQLSLLHPIGQGRTGTILDEGDAAGTYRCLWGQRVSTALVVFSDLRKVKLLQPPGL